MKFPAFFRYAFLGTGCLFVAPVTCNSIFTKSKPIDTTNESYEYVDVVGSNIPQRVVKGQRPVTPSPVGFMGADAFVDGAESSPSRGRADLNGPPHP